jgi:HK97 family phage major capsid protein
MVATNEVVKGYVAGTLRGSAKVGVPGRVPVTKALIVMDANLKPGVQSSGVAPLPQAALALATVIPSTPLREGTLQTVRQKGTHAAAGIQILQGDQKAEGTVQFATVQLVPETLACWVPVSRQAVQDVDGLAAFIDGELMYAVKLLEEDQILNGTSTFATPVAGQLFGLNTNASVVTTASTTALDAIADLLGSLLASGVQPTAIVVNPVDWLGVSKVKTSTGEYVLGGPGSAPSQMLWSTPLVLSSKQPAGVVLSGDFSRGSHLWFREDSTVEVSSEHLDYFTKNLLAAKCEERILLEIRQPGAFGKVALPGGA